MKRKAEVPETNGASSGKKTGLQVQGTGGMFFPASAPVNSSFPAGFTIPVTSFPLPFQAPSSPAPLAASASASASVASVSFPATIPISPVFPGGLPYLDLNIYREPCIKALIREESEDLYRLIKKVHFDGRYSRVKCVRFGAWEYCWELAVKIRFFGMMQGLAVEPERIVLGKSRKITYRSLILVNPYELWDEELVERLWNLQERIEFLIAKILFHECIHVLIFLGKTLPAGFEQTDIFLEFRELLELANSEKLYPKRQEVFHRLRQFSGLTGFSGYSGSSGFSGLSENSSRPAGKKQEALPEIYEFLIHEKYSIKKTDLSFGLSWSNEKIARDYAKLAALKLGPCPPSGKKQWEAEVRRLRRALKKLYDRLDEEQHSM